MTHAKPQTASRYPTSIDSRRYTIVKRLTGGGMSDVYVARDLKFSGRKVAIKMLKNAQVDNPELRKRLRQEIAVCAALESEHVVQVSDYGVTSAGHPYCVMEYLEGQTLGQLLATERPLSPERAIRIATQVCVGLQVAHRGVILKPNRSRKRVHVVHRDLKPDNIFLVPHPVWGEMVKILDFGIAKLYWEQWTNSNATSYGFKGSLRYAAPEQWAGSDRLDGRTDLYSLGVVLYEMLSGTNPFGIDKTRDTSLQSWLEAHTRAEPIPLNRQPGCESLAPELVAAVMRCLAKEPADRFANADDLRSALEPFMPQATIPPTSAAPPERSPTSSALNLPVPPHLLGRKPQASASAIASNTSRVPVVDVFQPTTTRGSSDPTLTLNTTPITQTAAATSSLRLWGALGTAAIAAIAGATWLWANPRAYNRATALADAGNYAEAIEVASAIPRWQRTREEAIALTPQWHYEQALVVARSGEYQAALGWVERFPTPEARDLVSELARMMDVEAAMGDRDYDRVVVSSSVIPAASPLFAAARTRMCEAVSASLAASVRSQLTTTMSGELAGPAFDSYQLQGCGTEAVQLQANIVSLENRQPENLKLIAVVMAGLVWESLPSTVQTDWQHKSMQIAFQAEGADIAVTTVPDLALVPQISTSLNDVLHAVDIQLPS